MNEPELLDITYQPKKAVTLRNEANGFCFWWGELAFHKTTSLGII